ncbi:hypothetical protein E4633_15625 [Geomonas terrae]|uniref:Uncharacterized protein n=1 Tax=Geomonas terrae TaxID=2562681 RepID=A0A4S1CE53_9BACT|nr:hypothetical protein [Geomonas terrae]TGU71729.1 hypothetical protein E4633_15625 [Geomonas terrae]
MRELDLVVYAGYPGSLKQHIVPRLATLKAFTCVGAISTVEQDQFSVRISEAMWEQEGDVSDDFQPGGISGAPVFSLFDFWDRKVKRREPKLVGFIQEGMAWASLQQKHYAVHATVLTGML